ncbi:MAG: hypothetical protein NTU51_05425 [Bacteroidetes bacterium]|nr:hypothetical protein [Bacteroidota bacterium]
MKQLPVLLIFIMIFCGCGRRSNMDADVSKIDCPPVKVQRYDLDLFNANTTGFRDDVTKLLPKYRLFLGDSLASPSKLASLKEYLDNPRNQDLIKAVRLKYPEVNDIEQGLTGAFKHFKYFFPSFRIPRVYAYISGGDYEYPVQYSDSVLLIGLDNYLGKDYAPYKADGVPLYSTDRMDERYVVPDCVRLLANSNFPVETGGGSLLDVMVESGKRLYIQDAILPQTPDRIKIGFTQAQYDWIKKNEFQVWAAIIENHMLYSNDGRIIRVFTSDGPFTVEFGKESPPLLGNWIGWQIVKQYMERNPDVAIERLLKEKDSQKILAGSKYKPEK